VGERGEETLEQAEEKLGEEEVGSAEGLGRDHDAALSRARLAR